jgi:hypothetical protein
MEVYYDGYRFSGTKPGYLTDPLYNTQLCLYFLRQLQKRSKFFHDVVDTWSRDVATADTSALMDDNVAVSENVTRILAGHPTMPFIQA